MRRRTRLGAVLLAVLATGCTCGTAVEEGLTGIDLTVIYPSDLGLDQLELSGVVLSDSSEAFPTGRLPEPPRALSSGEDDAVIVVRDALGGEAVRVRVEGLADGAPLTWGETDVELVRGQRVPATVTLLDPGACGDGTCTPPEDSCSCALDCGAGLCGDGVCCAADGEDACGCPADCGAGRCGDALCCPADGENACACPDDCGAGRCGDGLCCAPAGEDAASCGPDCGCGDGTCAANEDRCSCPEDCGAGSCGDGICCPDQGEDDCTCTTDCGSGSCGDGVCCAALSEDVATCATDCLICGDGSCDSPENLCSCPDDCGGPTTCGDGVCCAEAGEDLSTCANDCDCQPSTLSVTGPGPVAVCETAVLSIDLRCPANASDDISCRTRPASLSGPVTFAGDDPGPWTDISSSANVEYRTWFNYFFDPITCDGFTYGRFRRFRDAAASWMQLGAPLNATGFRDLEVHYRQGYRDGPNPGDMLTLMACCGAGCTPAVVGGYPPASGGGTDACTDYVLPLPPYADDCAELMLRFAWPSSPGRAGIDNVAVRGTPILTPVVDEGGGLYSTSLRSCIALSTEVGCSWTDGVQGPLQDSVIVEFQ